MDSKLLLIKTITLLYCESICPKVNRRSDELAQEIVSRLRIPEKNNGNTLSDPITGLRETLNSITEQPHEVVFDFNSLLQRIRINAGDEHSITQAFEDVEEYENYSEDKLSDVIKKLRKEVRAAVNQWALRDIIFKAHRELFYQRKSVNWEEYTKNLVAELERFSNGWSKDQKQFVNNLVNMSDKSGIKKALEKAKEESRGSGGFKTGWQRVNKMLGRSGLFHRGEFVLVGALQHNYKSGFLHDIFRHFCIYNDPVNNNPDKTPIILYFSAENSQREDIMRMYVTLKENEQNAPVNNIDDIDIEEASDYISQRLTERGWEVSMQHVDPNEFTHRDLFSFVLDYEARDYEVHACLFDYLTLVSKKGVEHSGATGDDVRALMQKVRTFMLARDILFITPHQLSADALTLKRQGVNDFLAEIVGRNYWKDSKSIANEADLEVFLDITQHNNKDYLAIHRGKHRTIRAAPKRNVHFYLPFPPQTDGWVSIPDDLHTGDKSVENLTGASADMEINLD